MKRTISALCAVLSILGVASAQAKQPLPIQQTKCERLESHDIQQLALNLTRCGGRYDCVSKAERKCAASLERFGCDASLCDVDGGLGAPGPSMCTFNTVETASAAIDDLLENQVLPALNTAWPMEAADMGLDPFEISMEVDVGCSAGDDAGNILCGLTLAACKSVKAKFHLSAKGLAELQFTDLSLKSLTTQDLSSFTSGEHDASSLFGNFSGRPPDGTSWNSPRAVVLQTQGSVSAITVDLADVYTLCANGVNCPPLLWQGSGDDTYRLETSTDGNTWTAWGDVPPLKTSNDLVTQNTRTLPGTPQARYVRVWALSTTGSAKYSVSRVAFFVANTSTEPMIYKPARGPHPKLATPPFPPAGVTAWNDPLATVLPNDGPNSAAGIDLGRIVYTKTDGVNNTGVQTMVSGNDAYRLEYSTDGISWTTWADLAATCGCTEIEFNSAYAPNVAARYFRIYHPAGTTGDGNYSVAKIQFDYTLAPTATEIFHTFTGVASSFGPEALATNNEFAPAGTAWNNVHYAQQLAITSGYADYLLIDLGASAGRGIDRVVLQADHNDIYQVDISPDAKTWSPLYRALTMSAGGLQTRDSGDSLVDPSTMRAWTGRYIRAYPVSGDGKYSISELQIYNDILVQGCPFDADANAIALGSAECSYSGDITASAALPASDPLDVAVTDIEVVAHCDDGISSYPLTIASGSATCTVDDLSEVADVDFCGVSCGQNAQPAFEVTYQQVASTDPPMYQKSCNTHINLLDDSGAISDQSLADLTVDVGTAIEGSVAEVLDPAIVAAQNRLLRSETPFPGETLGNGDPAVCTE